jgi:hypothetical protein
LNIEINLYKLTNQEQSIVNNYQRAKLDLINKFNATWYKNQICKIFENVEVQKAEAGDEYRYWLSVETNDYDIDFKLTHDCAIIYLLNRDTRRKGNQVLEYVSVNYNMQKIQEIKNQIMNKND